MCMETLGDKKFDHILKEKFDSFEVKVPSGLWANIEEDLDAVQTNESIGIEKKALILTWVRSNKNIEKTKIKRIVMLFGSVAALLFITFVFIRNHNSDVVYLKVNTKKQLVKIPLEKKKSDSEANLSLVQKLPDMKSNLVLLAEDSVTELRSQNNVFEQKVQTYDVVVEKNQKSKVLKEEVLDQAITLVSVNRFIETREPFSSSVDLPIFTYKEINSQHENSESSWEATNKDANAKKLRLSTVLNFLTKGFNSERGNPIEFTETDEGILKLAIKASLVKSPN